MVKIKPPKRWDKPFSEEMSEADVDRILASEPFDLLNPDDFSSSLPLHSIIANDTRLVTFQAGEVVVRKGEYGGSAFVPLSGTLCLITKDFESLNPVKKRFDFFKKDKPDRLGFQLYVDDEHSQHLTVSPQFIESNRDDYSALENNNFYGEIAALVRGTRQATLFAGSCDLELVEIRWQGLRDLMRYDADLRLHIQTIYKERSLRVQMANAAIFSHLQPEQLDSLCQASTFASYGEFEWQYSFKQTKNQQPADRLKAEPLIAQEGKALDSMILICSGFARLSQRINHGEKTIGYLKQGDIFGTDELAQSWGKPTNDQPIARYSLRALGHVTVVLIPIAAMSQFGPDDIARQSVSVPTDDKSYPATLLDTDILEQLVEHRFINGTSTMVIDRHRCTGCDDCVNACATLHNDQPRFNRNGRVFGQYQVAHACMHCTDPVCLIGCPTGAIHRNSKLGDILVDDNTCIGCSACATSCPYDNIFMREVLDRQGRSMQDAQTGLPILKASKCDLCAGHGNIPACEQACPHDALKRLDMADIASFVDWFNR